ncbi:MAG: YerC/YecD family TrpR-related protein [Cellulosilyticaceae bacterium]
MNSKLKDEMTDRLFEAVLTLDSIEECYAFFEDICTINEIKSLAQRLEVAKMLKEKRTYSDIQHTTGASTATISRVNRALSYGSDGYQMVLDRLGNQ